MKNNILTILFLVSCFTSVVSQNSPRYLVENIFTADPSVHLFKGKIFIYPSHDIESGNKDGSGGNHYDMRDYQVFSLDSLSGQVTDHGVVLALAEIPWASRQLWAPDCEYKNGKYYFYFPAKDKNDNFRIGVAVGKRPTGPFVAQANPIMGSYSIDPAIFKDVDGAYYMYFGGLKGGQLQRYRQNKTIECGQEPGKDEDALCPKIARLSDNMLQFAEEPKDVLILDEEGHPLKAGDEDRRFFEGAWVHKYNGKYYFSYSTGSTHKLCYAVGDSPYGPFIYKGVILTPVEGWTTHHSIVEINKQWCLFYHDTKHSHLNYLRQIKVRKLDYNADGIIVEMNGKD